MKVTIAQKIITIPLVITFAIMLCIAFVIISPILIIDYFLPRTAYAIIKWLDAGINWWIITLGYEYMLEEFSCPQRQ